MSFMCNYTSPQWEGCPCAIFPICGFSVSIWILVVDLAPKLLYSYIECYFFTTQERGAKMAIDEHLFPKLRRFFLISNIVIVALITVLWIILAFLTFADSYEDFIDIALIGLAITIPGWVFLILYGFGCYDTKDWRRTVSAILASIQIIVFLLLLIFYFIEYFF